MKNYIESNSNQPVYLVEGIFDTLSLKSQGFYAIGNMGLELSYIKSQILLRVEKVVAIPDNDNAGRKTNPYLNSGNYKDKKFVWQLPKGGVFVILPKGIKDIDEFIKVFDCKEDLLLCAEKQGLWRMKEDED